MKFEFSAGGVVYRSLRNSKQDVSQYSRALRPLRGLRNIEFLIVQHSGHHRWVLPKGWIEKGEKKEEAALREVKEEAGVEAEIKDYLGDFEIFYVDKSPPAGGEKVKKKNYFYLMEYKSGDPEKEHGWEVENVIWLSGEEATKKLDYPGEKKMVERAVQLLK